MKKEYKKQKGENLARWCERIAAACQGRSLEEVHEMISEVSKTSYIEGVHAEREISKKYGRAEELGIDLKDRYDYGEEDKRGSKDNPTKTD